MAILLSDKIDFKTKIVMRQRRTLYNEQSVNQTRRYNNYKHIYVPNKRGPKYHAKFDRIEGSRWFNNSSGRVQHATFSKGENS